MTLKELKINKMAKIKNIKEKEETIKRRMLDLGIISGSIIKPVLKSPLGSLRAYEIRGSLIAIRTEEAEKIEIDV